MKSIWSEGVQFEGRGSLNEDLAVDVLIIGGGMAGLLTALRLKENGVESVIIEAKRICSGQTENTTAKITSQHGVIYSRIEKQFGPEGARQYASANQRAIEQFKRIVEQNRIECNFEKKDAYLYTTQKTNKIIKEMEAAIRAGISCHFEKETELPLKTTGAVVFDKQAQFNPLRFAKAISEGITIYENTPAIKIEDSIVFTPKAKIKANKIVIACHYPFINFPSMLFLRMSQERSYALALEGTGARLSGMYIGEEKNSLSFRQYKDYVLLGGGGHRAGCSPDENCYDALSLQAHRLYPECEIRTKWSAQDCITIDGLPYIGKFSEENDSIFVATGFNKWGMTTSMVSADIITDMICEKENESSEIFSPQRFKACAGLGGILTNSFETAKGFSAHLLPAMGKAREIRYKGKKAGAYRAEDGRTYIVSLNCPHLKCKLSWNDTTKSWDCPCHGSRYSYKGELMDNPAQQESILIAVEQ